MIMVSNRMVDRERDVLGILQVFGITIIIDLPVKIPGHIPKGNAIHLASDFTGLGIDVLHKGTKLLPVVSTPGQMDIAKHHNRVSVLRTGFQKREIRPLRNIGHLRKRHVEGRKDILGSQRLISGRDRHKNVSVRLCGIQTIDTIFVGFGHQNAIRDYDVFQSLSATGNNTVNGCAFGINRFAATNDYAGFAHFFHCLATLDVENIIP